MNPNSFIAEVTGSYKNTTGSAQNVSFQAVPVDSTGAGNKVKVQHSDGSDGWVEVSSGMIRGQDPSGHPVSSRRPNSR